MDPEPGLRRNQPWMLAPTAGNIPQNSDVNKGKIPRVSFAVPLIPRKDGLDDGQVEGNYDPKYRPTQHLRYLWDTACALVLHLSVRMAVASRIDRRFKMRFWGRLSAATRIDQKLNINFDLTGKNALITGTGGGGILGMEMAKTMVEAAATVWLACPTKQQGDAAKKEIIDYLSRTNQIEIATVQKQTSGINPQDPRRDSTGEALKQPTSKINPMVLDLTSDESIRKFCDEDMVCYIDVLIHHANVTAQRPGDKVGSMYLTNVLGPFQLTCRLEKLLSPGARVIFANSFIHYFGGIANGRSRSKGTERDFAPLWILTISRIWNWLWSPLVKLIWAWFWVPLKALLSTLAPCLGTTNKIERLQTFRNYATMMQMQIAMVTLLAERWSDQAINDMFAPDYAPPPRKAIHMQAPLTVREKKISVHAYNTGMPKAWFFNNMRKWPTSLLNDPA